MQITFLNPVGVIGGAERVLLAAIRGACDRLENARLSVVLLADGPLRAEAERLGASVTVVPLPAELARQGDTQHRGKNWARTLAGLGWTTAQQTPAAVSFVKQLRAALRRLEPDLIHSNGFKTHILAALARPRGTQVLWHLHDFPSHRPVIASVLRRVSRGVARGIAISDAVRSDAKSVFPGMPISVIRNAVNTDHFTPAHSDGAKLDRLAGLLPAACGTIRVGLTATYANWKGQDIFLHALSKLPASGQPIRGYIIGGPIYTTTGSQFSEAELRDHANRLGLADRVGFIPYQPDPADVYRMLDIAVHASTRPEPFGLTIAEAMSCGKPVIVASAGGAVELFTQDHDGLGHTPGSPENLAQAITKLAGDPELRARLGGNARRTALEKFSQERYAREIAAVYNTCLREQHRVATA